MSTLHETNIIMPAVAGNTLRTQQVLDFLTDAFGAVHTFYPDSNGTVWLDSTHSAGFAPDNGYGKIRLIAGDGAFEELDLISFGREMSVGYQCSLNGDVLYFRVKYDNAYQSMHFPKIVAAKAADGKWSIFYGDKMFCSRGIIRVSTTAYADTNAPFAITRASSLFDGQYTELYKVISATSFEVGSTIIAADGKPYRVVSVSADSGNTAFPCFAFPVADSD